MKVLFLDVDGVLNTFDLVRRNGFDYIDPDMVRTLGLVVSRTSAAVVLSSFWRLNPRDRRLVDVALGDHGMFVHDRTPLIPGPRAREISSWLEANSTVANYAIVDDDEGAGEGLEACFFQTDPDVGITVEIAEKIILHLNGGVK